MACQFNPVLLEQVKSADWDVVVANANIYLLVRYSSSVVFSLC